MQRLEFAIAELMPVLERYRSRQWWERFLGGRTTITPIELEGILERHQAKNSTKGKIVQYFVWAIRCVYGGDPAQDFWRAIPRKWRNAGVVMETGWSTKGLMAVEHYHAAQQLLRRLYELARRRQRKIADLRLRQAAWLALFYRSGLRRGEMLSLRKGVNFVKDGDIYLITVRTLKQHGWAERRLQLKFTDPWEATVVDYLYHNTPDGQTFAELTQLRALWDMIRRKLGQRLRYHDLRHARATLAANAGVPLPQVSWFLGHRSPISLRFYVQPQEASIDISELG